MSKQLFFGKEIRTDIRETQVTQIYNILAEEIAHGRWALNARFPSVTQLVNQSGLSRGSIQKVLARLDADGLIATEARRGTFVISLKSTVDREPEAERRPTLKKSDAAPKSKAHTPTLGMPVETLAAAYRNSETNAPIPEPVYERAEPHTPIEIEESPTAPQPSIAGSASPLHIPEIAQNPFAPRRGETGDHSATSSTSSSSVSEARIGIALVKNDPRIQSAPGGDPQPVLEGLLGMVQEFGYRSSVAFFERSPDWEVLARDGGPFDDQVDGIIALSSGGFADFTDPPEGAAPIVFIGGADCRALPGVTQDFALGAYRITRDLAAAGHTQIALCPGSGLSGVQNDAFLSGHREAMKRVGLSVDEEAITNAATLQNGDFNSLRTFLLNHRTATAVLCGDPHRAADLVALCDALGIHIPSDLTIATAGRTPMRGDRSGETITGFEFPPEKTAHAALLLLDEMIHTGSCQFTQVKIPPSIISGNSLAAPRK